jgi:hypothetical protein
LDRGLSGPQSRIDAVEKREILPYRVLDAIKEVFDIYVISKLVNPILSFVRICVRVTSHEYYKINVLRMPWSEPLIVDSVY